MKEHKDIVSAEWLNQNLDDKNLLLLDATLNSSVNLNVNTSTNVTIPNSRKFDLDNVFVDKQRMLPNSMPKPKEFELACRDLGINNDSKIVVFDRIGVFSSPRAWWLFKVMGHKNVSVLNGGFPNWIRKGFKTQIENSVNCNKGNFKSNFNVDLYVDFDEVKSNVCDQKFKLIDARSESRFLGLKPEPRPNQLSGHIPNSLNLPYESVLSNGELKEKNDLQKLFSNKFNENDPLVFSCGSGITACIVMLASAVCGNESKRLYDGSWNEWSVKNQNY